MGNFLHRCVPLTILFFFLSPILHSQEPPPPPIEWGTIETSDLEMKTYAPDTNAAAVILCDYGVTSLNDFMNLVFKRHLRIKILNQKGFEWGTHAVTLYIDRKSGETIDDIEGVTYIQNTNGKVEALEFDDDEVFEEKIDDTHTRYKFTLPGLQPGCIVELRYTIIARNFFYARDWTFQHSEPVRWSEYRIIHPLNLGFTIVTKGYERFTVQDNEQYRQYFSGEAQTYLKTNLAMCAFRRFAVKDLAALRDEQYITTLEDYFTKVEVQFSGYATYAGFVERVLNTWETFVDELLDSRTVGKRIEVTGNIEELVEKITTGTFSVEEKVRVIYKWINTSIVWTGRNTMFAEQKMNEVLETKKGTSGEITFLLISMLQAIGVQSEPVILSTRENGKVQELYPILSQFNYVVARAKVGSKIIFLDASNMNRPMELLPAKVLGVRGLVVQPGQIEWVTLQSQGKSNSNIMATVSIDDQGGAHGTIEGQYKDYANVNIRESLSDRKKEDVAKDYFTTETSGLTLDSVLVSRSDSVDLPLTMKAWVSSPSFAQTGNDLLYLNPHIISRWKDNPFKSSVRKFPIDYNYPREYLSVINITIPYSYEIKEKLRDRELSVGGDVTYRRLMTIDSSRIQLVTKFEILRKELPATQYQKLKDLYAAMISMESEQIVLQKRSQPVPSQVPIPVPEKTKAVKKPIKKKK